MPVTFNDLDPKEQAYIKPHLRPFFDQVTFDTRTLWVMEYGLNDYEGISTFDTMNYMDKREFEAVKYDLFLNGDYLYKFSKYGSLKLMSKERYEQPQKWHDNEVINLRNTNDFEDMRITMEIRRILFSEQSIELTEMDFVSYNRTIALIVNSLESIDCSLAQDCKGMVERIVLHFSGPKSIFLSRISQAVDTIHDYFSPDLTEQIGLCVNPDLTEELISIYLFIKE